MIIDCDVHHAQRSMDQIIEHIPEPYKTEVAKYGWRQLQSGIRYEDGGTRWDTTPPNGGGPGTDPEFLKEQHLDRYGIRYALLSGYTGPFAGVPDADYVAAICTGFNDFTLHDWVSDDNRFKMGIHIPLQDPQLAVAEIERLGDHSGVIAICICGTASRIPFGQRYYWPIYEAAQRKNLPLHFHPSTTSVIANYASTPAGMASTYLESHTCLPQFYMAYLASFIFEGVFERFPNLRVAFVEGGIAWLPHMLWRMDKEFKALRQQAPYLKRLPSEYIKDHVRLTTQPIEEPRKIEQLVQIFDMIDGDEIIMYASDYPHFDFDEPSVIPKQLSDATRHRLLHDNACQFFNLPMPEPKEKR
jgi:predicted TIM-barrel fold metal-dependent hydrolase